MEVESC